MTLLEKAKLQLAEKLGRDATPDELCEHLNGVGLLLVDEAKKVGAPEAATVIDYIEKQIDVAGKAPSKFLCIHILVSTCENAREMIEFMQQFNKH